MENYPQCKLASVSFIFYTIFHFVYLKLASVQTLTIIPAPLPRVNNISDLVHSCFCSPEATFLSLGNYSIVISYRKWGTVQQQGQETKSMLWKSHNLLISSPKQNLLNKSKKLCNMWPIVYRTTFESTDKRSISNKHFLPFSCLAFHLNFFLPFLFCFCFFVAFCIGSLGCW